MDAESKNDDIAAEHIIRDFNELKVEGCIDYGMTSMKSQTGS